MKDVEETLRALDRVKRRKNALKSLIGVLREEYELAKTEIKMHEELIEKWMSDKEYAAYLDTIGINASLELPDPSDQRSTNKK